MWWYKFLIFLSSAICVMQLFQPVHGQEFLTPEELFANLRKNSESLESEEQSSDVNQNNNANLTPEELFANLRKNSDSFTSEERFSDVNLNNNDATTRSADMTSELFVPITSSTTAPVNQSPTSTATPVAPTADTNESSSFIKKTQTFDEKSTAKVKTNSGDGTETEFQSGPTLERKTSRNLEVHQIRESDPANFENELIGKALLDEINVPEILKQRGFDIQQSFPEFNGIFHKQFDINIPQDASANPAVSTNFNNNLNAPPGSSWTTTSLNKNNFKPLLPHAHNNFNSPPHQTWTHTSSDRNNFNHNPYLMNSVGNFNSSPRQTGTPTSTDRNNFDSTPLLSHKNNNFNSPPHQTWTHTSSDRNNLNNNPFLPNSGSNFNSVHRQTWTHTSSDRNNFNSNPSVPNTPHNYNLPPRQTWTPSSDRNTFNDNPFLPNSGSNFNSPPGQTWTPAAYGRINFHRNPPVNNLNTNFNTPSGQTWTRTSTNRNNFDSKPFLDNFNMNFNAPNHQSWTHSSSRNTFNNVPGGFRTDGHVFDKTHGDGIALNTYGPIRNQDSGFRTIRTTDPNGRTFERTIRW